MRTPRSSLARAAVSAAALLLAACPGPRAPRGPGGATVTGCLPLPGASRAALRLSPDGSHLYWTEEVRVHAYQDTMSSTTIVRWPVAGGPVERVTSLLENPYRVLRDGRIVGVRKEGGVAIWSPDDTLLVSVRGTIDHLELLASEDAVVFRSGDAIWRQPLWRESESYVSAAGELLGVDGERVFVIDGEGALVAIDARTGARQVLPAQQDIAKIVTGAIVVSTDDGLGLRSLTGGAVEPVLTGEGWDYRLAPDGLKAWRRSGPKLEAAIVTGAGADPVPPVLGADSLEGFVRLPDGRVAYLVGHELDGDGEVTSSDEIDVCLVAGASKELRVEPRQAPLRWHAAEAALNAAVEQQLGRGTWHFSSSDEDPGFYVETETRRASDDAIRADARALATAVAAATGDVTLDLGVLYGDGHRGYSQWWAGAGRRLAWAGIGGATVSDPDEYDAVFTATFAAEPDEDDGDSAAPWRCVGLVTNRTDHPLVDLSADCVGGELDDKLPVTPATLAPGQTGRFDGVVQRDGDAVLQVSIHTGPGYRAIAALDQQDHQRSVERQRLAAELLDRARVTYRAVEVGEGTVTVTLQPDDDFATWSGQAQDQAAGTADEIVRRAGPVALGGVAGDDVRLHLVLGDDEWWVEHGQLRRGEP